MWLWADRLGGILLDASLAATALLCVVALAILGCRQPARRVPLARSAIIGSMALIPLVGLSIFPRIDLLGGLRASGLLPHPLVSSQATIVPSPLLRPPVEDPPGPLSKLALSSRARQRVLRVLTLGYLGCVGCGVAWLLLGWFGLRWLNRNATAPSEATAELYQRLPFCPKRQRPDLRVSTAIQR